ncbi:MAG: HAD-IIB family hydrolase, partial [Candidatus Methylomirabilis sp.]
EQVSVSLVGFGDMTVEDIVKATGLARSDAERARQREYDEPFLIEGSTISLEGIREAAQRLGLAVTPGGRFFHLVGGADKGRACRLLIELYRKEWGDVSTAGIGDSLNDLSMLEVVDRPFLVERPEGGYAEGIALEDLTRLPGIGPTGWNQGVNRLLRASTPHATGSAPTPYVDGTTGWYPGSQRDLI